MLDLATKQKNMIPKLCQVVFLALLMKIERIRKFKSKLTTLRSLSEIKLQKTLKIALNLFDTRSETGKLNLAMKVIFKQLIHRLILIKDNL